MATNRRKRVLALTYVVSPVRGSEFAVAWNYIQAMRSYCDLTILYGSAGPHMGDVCDFECANFVDDDGETRVHFRFIEPPPLARLLNALNRRGILVYTFYLAYRVWHKAAFRVAEAVLADGDYDLVHYVGPIGYREPGYLWRLAIPFVWGPIGGATSFPWRLRRALPKKGCARLILRSVINAAQLRFSRRVTLALQRADFLFSATTENQAIFETIKGVSSSYLPENGIAGEITLNAGKFPPSPIRAVWIGSLEPRKGLTLLLRAICLLRTPQAFEFGIIGDGELREGLAEEAASLGIQQYLRWYGQVARQEVLDVLDDAHLHVVTGLNEGNPTSIWEALSKSVPVVAFDHCGMHDTVGPPYGVRVPVGDVEQTVASLAAALQTFADQPQTLETMARACASACDTWRIAYRPAALLAGYDEAIARYRSRSTTR